MDTVAPPPLPAALPPLRDSSDALVDSAELRRRADEDGYLLFRGLLPADAVVGVRDEMYRRLAADGVLVPGGSLVDHDRFDQVPDEDIRLDIGVPPLSYVHLQQVRRMHHLPHHPRLMELYGRLLDGPVFVHPRHIVRAMTGHPALRPTPPHQDFPLVQGTTRTWTTWFPLDDCPLAQGPLAVLRGSHRNGYLPIAPAEGAGQIQAQLCTENDWVASDMAIGDVLCFTSLTVHRAVPPQSRDRIRLSMDVRYQSVSDAVEARSLTNHAQVDWAEIYRDWPADDLQYYWQEGAPRLSPWDDSLLQPTVRIC